MGGGNEKRKDEIKIKKGGKNTTERRKGDR